MQLEKDGERRGEKEVRTELERLDGHDVIVIYCVGVPSMRFAVEEENYFWERGEVVDDVG